MPQCKTPGSLKHVCISSIARNVGYWTQDYEDKYLDKGRYRLLLGPFDDIPSPMLVQELVNSLIQQRKLTRPALHLLINGGSLQYMDFSDCPRLITDEIVYMIADKCKMLKSLNLSGCSRVTTQALNVLASSLPYAIKLNFTKTRIGTLALQSLFRLCTDLQELTLKHCQVCDNDVGVLCNLALQRERFPLRTLDLSSSMVTDMGIRALLRSLPLLQEFRHSNLVHCIIAESPILEEYQDQYLRGSQLLDRMPALHLHRDTGQNGLRRLECSDFCSVTDQDLRLISLSCPKLVSLDLRFARGFSKRGLMDLQHLEHLQELKLASSDELSFRNGVDRFLKAHGCQLTVLSLEDFDGLDLSYIGQLCPNIRKLMIFMMEDDASFTSRENNNRPVQPMFEYLEELALWCTNTDTTLTHEMLSAVFTQTISLRSLEVIRVAAFTDSILEEAILSHGFTELKTLALHECNAVSRSGISQLIVDERNTLDTLTLMDCFAVTKRDFEGWCKLVKKRNYNLAISWK